jgi:hypothetical protein
VGGGDFFLAKFLDFFSSNGKKMDPFGLQWLADMALTVNHGPIKTCHVDIDRPSQWRVVPTTLAPTLSVLTTPGCQYLSNG